MANDSGVIILLDSDDDTTPPSSGGCSLSVGDSGGTNSARRRGAGEGETCVGSFSPAIGIETDNARRCRRWM
jgi:hypothetical protein